MTIPERSFRHRLDPQTEQAGAILVAFDEDVELNVHISSLLDNVTLHRNS